MSLQSLSWNESMKLESFSDNQTFWARGLSSRPELGHKWLDAIIRETRKIRGFQRLEIARMLVNMWKPHYCIRLQFDFHLTTLKLCGKVNFLIYDVKYLWELNHNTSFDRMPTTWSILSLHFKEIQLESQMWCIHCWGSIMGRLAFWIYL